MNKDNYSILSRTLSRVFTINLLSSLSAMLGMTIDGIVISRFLGSAAMASFSLAIPLLNIIELLAAIIGTGVSVVCAKEIGAGHLRKANHVITMTVLVTAVFSAAVSVCGFVFSEQLAGILGGSAGTKIVFQTAEYIRGVAFSFPAMILCVVLIPIMQMDGDEKRAYGAVAALTLVNISGDILNVLVFHGGMTGMGISTVLSYFSGFAVLFSHFFAANACIRLEKGSADILEVCRKGIPTITNRVSTVLRNTAFNRLAIDVGGATLLSAFSVVNTMSFAMATLPKAFGSTMLVSSGLAIGEKDRDSLLKVAALMIRKSLIISTSVCIALFFLAPLLAGIFVSASDPASDFVIKGVRWYGLCLIPYSLNIMYFNYLEAAGKPKLANVISLLDGFTAVYAAALALCGRFGADGIAMSYFAGKTAVSIVIVAGVWIHHGQMSCRLEDFLLLGEEYDIPEDCIIDVTITSGEQVIGLSEKIGDFCRLHEFDERKTYIASLTVEEMAGNITSYGFQSDDKEHRIDIRVVIDKENMVIRFRDDCVAFNPKKKLQVQQPDDPMQNIGIRMISRLASRFEYTHALGLNNLIIEI